MTRERSHYSLGLSISGPFHWQPSLSDWTTLPPNGQGPILKNRPETDHWCVWWWCALQKRINGSSEDNWAIGQCSPANWFRSSDYQPSPSFHKESVVDLEDWQEELPIEPQLSVVTFDGAGQQRSDTFVNESFTVANHDFLLIPTSQWQNSGKTLAPTIRNERKCTPNWRDSREE